MFFDKASGIILEQYENTSLDYIYGKDLHFQQEVFHLKRTELDQSPSDRFRITFPVTSLYTIFVITLLYGRKKGRLFEFI